MGGVLTQCCQKQRAKDIRLGVKNLIVVRKLRVVPQPNAVRNSGQKTLGGGNIKSVGYGVG